jgi:cystathionine beta-lyase/cystathionine gamma-synthase
MRGLVGPGSDGSVDGFSTRAVHAAVAPEVVQRPSSVPIYQTSTWGFETAEEYAEVIAFRSPGHVYGRGYGNPTVEAFEAAMANLEETEAAFGLSSGMSAVHTVVTALAASGDRVVASRELYGGTFALFAKVLPRYGVAVDWVDPHDLAAVSTAIDGARLCYVETIANPRCTVADLAGIAQLCADAGVPAVIDNTFASPYLCRPAALGYDFVLHSATKYIGGHSDLIGGVVCCSEEGRRRLRETSIEVGGAMEAFEAWLCIRGLQTLTLRVERQCATALRLAMALDGHPRVAAVHYPGLPSHPNHERAAALLRDGMFGGVLAFEVEGDMTEVAKVCESLRLGWLAASLGGAHTLVTHPASTTHRQLDADARRGAGVSDGLVRVSVGLEDAEDIVADFEQALGG